MVSVSLSSSELDQTGRHPSMRGVGRFLNHPRSRTIFLQSLVAGILSYELLVSNETIFGHAVSRMVAVGLILISCGIMLLPRQLLERSWFPGALISINTVLVHRDDLSFGERQFRTVSHLFPPRVDCLFSFLSQTAARPLIGNLRRLWRVGVRTCRAVRRLAVGHLLGIPILLIMAVFYGLTLETVATERRRNRSLQENVQGLKQSEQALEQRRTQLETRVQGLKQGLSRANQEIRQGMVERTGLERQLREAQKFEAVGRLASRLAHEFNQVLAVIGKETGVILSKLKPNDPLQASGRRDFSQRGTGGCVDGATPGVARA